MKMNTPINTDVTVIIRTFAERSIDLCLNSVLAEVNESNVFVIKETPFCKAVQRTFQLGISNNKRWTLAIDADLILIPNSISTIIKQAETHYENLYVYQGFILDKFKCGIRQGGPHLYKTENLTVALKMIENDDISLRPESDIYKKMLEQGYDVVLEKKIYALHDFFQFYKDIYRKTYFHGIKHKGWKNLLPIWLERGLSDPDYKVACIGFIDGYFAEKQVYPSINDFDFKIKHILCDQLNIAEKETLNFSEVELLEETIKSYNISYNEDLDIILPKKSILIKIKNKFFS